MSNLPNSMAAALGGKLKTARQAAGLSTREVANRISGHYPLTHATISNYESARTTPSLDVLSILANFYGRPLNWFLESGIVLTNIHYRNLKSRTKASELRQFEASAQQWLEAYRRLEDWLDVPSFSKRIDFKVERGSSGRKAADQLRLHLGLRPEDPVRSVAELLDDFGIRTIELRSDLAIDGMAAQYGDEYAIVLNPRVANDRCRMNAAHELGHVILEDCAGECGHGDSLKEKRAYEFGSHLLISQSQLEEAFKGRSMVKLVRFKEQFGISLQAMVYRAQQTGILKESEAKWLWIEFTKRGWRKLEPGLVRPDRATRFEDLVSSAVGEGRLTWSSAAKLMRVPEADLHQRIDIALGGKSELGLEKEGGDLAEDRPEVFQFRRD